MKRLIAILSVFLPWPLRRRILGLFLGYELHPTSRIGFSLIFPSRLRMGPRSTIGHFNVCKGLDLLEMGESALIGRLNWITGFPSPSNAGEHFHHETDRRSELICAQSSAITSRHLIDCTNSITIGEFAILGGFRCQLLTHSIEILEGRQGSAPIRVGAYCFVSTNCVLLGGTCLPDHSVLSASSLLNKPMHEQYMLYGGVPARPIKQLARESRYFNREAGYII